MHCYAPNFEEVEGANLFGPVRLSIHLPLPSPPSSLPPKKNYFKFGFFVKKKSLTLAPPPPPPPYSQKNFFFFYFKFGLIVKIFNYSSPTHSLRPPAQFFMPPRIRRIAEGH